MLRAFRVAYDGGLFHGFQRQPDVPTVEERVFDALRELAMLGSAAGKPPGHAAGRTDANVSAAAQTVSVRVPRMADASGAQQRTPGKIKGHGESGSIRPPSVDFGYCGAQ
jgi:tRNA pseudouridine38-40 synthase